MFFGSNDRLVLCFNSQLKIYSFRAATQPVIVEIPKPESKHDSKNAKQDAGDSNGLVICGGFSSSGNLVAVCDSNKRLLVWQSEESGTKWRLTQEFKVARKCVKLVFTSNEKQILVGDRSGDVYIYELGCASNPEGTLLMGHLSMLLDFDITGNGKYLVTCDRDEKIRISCFPNSYNIHGYCLGHTEFVSSFCFLSDNSLISGSGDGTIRIWNYVTGEEISVHDCSADIKLSDRRTAVKQVLKLNESLIAVIFYGFNDVLLYKIDCTNNFSISFSKRVNVSKNPLHKIVRCNNFIVIITVNKDDMFIGYDFNCESFEITKRSEVIELVKRLNTETKFIDKFYEESEREEKSLDGLYKTWFNNVETYLEKKKERQEAKKLKKCTNSSKETRH